MLNYQCKIYFYADQLPNPLEVEADKLPRNSADETEVVVSVAGSGDQYRFPVVSVRRVEADHQAASIP